MSNSHELRKIIKHHNFTRKDVSEILCVSKSTINSWLAPENSVAYRKMPKRMLELLKLKIGIRN
jgi:transcriptional regulator with XRE-family HTH domain